MPKFLFSVKVNAPTGTTEKKAKQILQRLIDVGLEDASNAPDDFDDPDVEIANKMTAKVAYCSATWQEAFKSE